MAKASAALEEEESVSFSPMVAESKEEYYDRVLKNSTNMDRVLEFLMFKREADKLLPHLRDELVKLLRGELDVDKALADLTLERRMTASEGTPLLDALGAKLGKSFSHILAPPTFSCLLCARPLKKNNEPSNVVLFTLSGPVVAFLQPVDPRLDPGRMKKGKKGHSCYACHVGHMGPKLRKLYVCHACHVCHVTCVTRNF